jgi:hypothetical protein
VIAAGSELFWLAIWLALGIIVRRTNRKTGKVQWFVMSHDKTKRLGGPYSSREQAEKRLAQVERAKHARAGGY